MITGARIYKKNGTWTTDISGMPALLAIMTNDLIRLKNGTTVGRWTWSTWNEAREFVFGPPYQGARGFKILRQRAWTLRHRQEVEAQYRAQRAAVCMIPGCGCIGDPHP